MDLRALQYLLCVVEMGNLRAERPATPFQQVSANGRLTLNDPAVAPHVFAVQIVTDLATGTEAQLTGGSD